jgi:hypothetical protein
VIVLTREEQGGPLAGEVLLERGGLAIELGGQLGIGRLLDELQCRQEVVSTPLECAPELNLRPEAACFPEDVLGGSLVVPEPGLSA